MKLKSKLHKLMFFLAISASVCTSAQEYSPQPILIYKETVTFSSYCKTIGKKCDNNMYKWQPLKSEHINIKYDKKNEIITVGDRKYEVLEKPTSYEHKGHKYKYTTIQTIDEYMKKVFVKISYYYDGRTSVAFLGEEVGEKYWVY